MKRKSMLVLLLLCTFIPLSAGADSAMRQFAAQQKDTAQTPSAERILYQIDDELFITQSDVELIRRSDQYNAQENRKRIGQDAQMDAALKRDALSKIRVRSDEEILDDLIGDLAALAEAKALKLTVSQAEAVKFLDDNENAVREAAKSPDPEEREPAQAILKQYDEFLKGMGMTKAEYREQIQVPKTVRLLTIGRIKTHLMETKNLSYEEVDEAYADYVKQLRKKYPSIAQ